MKYLDIVELIVDKDEYKAKGVQKGMRGRITDCDVFEDKKRLVFFVLGKGDNRFVVTALHIPKSDLRVAD